jgi:hypothetical protein
MAYTINKTNGTILANVADGQIDNLSSDITLIGKNYSGFGEFLNENFVKLLENFANTSRPARPVTGQIWFDSTELKLKVYNGTSFVPVSSAIVSNTRPGTLSIGDLWFNQVDKQLYFFDGTNTILLGPDYSESQGLSGLKVSTILDKQNTSRVVTLFYNNGILLGIFSKDEFIPKVAIPGFNNVGEDKIISPGFNAGNLSGIKFKVTCENAEQLDGVVAATFARRDEENIFEGQVSIKSDAGITFGEGFQGLLEVDLGNVIFSNSSPNRQLTIKVKKGANSESAINVDSINRKINLYSDFTDSSVLIGGSLIINRDLTVNGTTTTINSTVLEVEDKNIELAKIEIPTDANADRGGIILKGATDHKFYWVYDSAETGEEYNQAWNSTENINLVADREFRIAGEMVLNSTTLGIGITQIPGVTQFGVLKVIDIGPSGDPPDPPLSNVYTRIKDNRISTEQTNSDLELAPNGTGNVSLIGSPSIVGLFTTSESLPFPQTTQRTNPYPPAPATPTIPKLSDDELSQSTSKKYVLNLVRTRSLVFSMDISDGLSNSGIAALLMTLAPPTEYEEGTIARILCTTLSNSSTTLNINSLLNKDRSIEYNTPSGTNFPLQDLTVSNATVSPPSIAITRIIKTFEIDNGVWVFSF